MEELFEKFLGAIELEKVLLALLSLVVCLVLMKLLRSLTDRMLKKSQKLDEALQKFIRAAVRVALWVLTALIVADALGIPTTSLVAVFSVVGLALSLSVQNIVGNLFSGVTLLICKPFVAGDFVDIAAHKGTVKNVGLFYTELDTIDNMLIHIPNADVTASTVVNYSAEALRRVDMLFCASYEDDTEVVRAAILEAVAEDSRILPEPAPFVGINAYRAGGVEYVAKLWANNEDYWDIYYNMNESVRESFRRHGITMSPEVLQVRLSDNKK